MPEGFDPDEIEAFLRAVARRGETVTYSEALVAFGHRFTRPQMRAFCKALADVDARANGKNEPELAVLVVRQSDRLPGEGWWVGRPEWQDASDAGKRRVTVETLQSNAFRFWSRRP